MVKEAPKDNRLVQYFRETRAELRKVVWPTRQEAINLTIIVISTVAVMSFFFGAIDYLLKELFRILMFR